MANSLKLLAQSALTASDATIYTVPASTTTVVKSVIICNTATAARTITLHAVASGGSSSVANRVLSALTIGAGETVFLKPDIYMTAGCTLRAFASVAAVVGITVSGVEMT